MNQMNIPHDLPNDSDVERIKARIRGQRFVLVDKKRMLWWSGCLGGVCGVMLGIWLIVSNYLHSVNKVPPGVLSLVVDLVEGIVMASLFGALGGAGLARFVMGLVRRFHPTYVALYYSPEEFELQYGDKPPKIG